MTLSVGTFTRIVAVLVGLVNVYAYGLYSGDDTSLWEIPRPELLVILAVTAVARLAVSEAVLRLARTALRGGFYAR